MVPCQVIADGVRLISCGNSENIPLNYKIVMILHLICVS